MRPVVSIIICTRNRAADLEQTLGSFRGLIAPADLPSELLVVDNASTDATPNVVIECRLPGMPVRYLAEPRPGQCYARNTALAQSRGKIILFTDDDVRVGPDWIEQMSRPILNGAAAAVAGNIRMAPHLRRPWMTDLHKKWLLDYDFSQSPRPRALIGANMAFSTEVLERVPAFDTDLGPGALGFGDDVLFAMQVEAAGFPITNAPQSWVEHHFQPSRLNRSSLLGRAKQEGRVAAYMCHHWFHSGYRLRMAREWKHAMELWWQRRGRPAPVGDPEGCPQWELELTRDLEFHRHYAVERRRRPNYSQQGLVRLDHHTATPITPAVTAAA